MTALSTLLALLSLDDSAYLEGLNSSQAATGSFATKLASVGGAIAVGAITAAGTAITAVGVAAWDAGNTMDEAMDTISVATGATGSDLEALRADFEKVFTDVPTDAGAAADAIGILNSRLDVTGPNLVNLAEPLLEASRLLGGDVTTNAEAFTRVIGDWGIPVDQASGKLDTLFVGAQQLGVPLDQLMQRIVQYGAPMRNFGFSFEESTALMSEFEAKGVNLETVMAGLRVAQGKFITQGKDLPTGLWEAIDAIQNETDATKALGIANDVFGARSAADMFDTIRGGKFDIEGLVGAMENADGAILNSADSTADWGEKWQKFQNQATVALAPVGEKMMEGVGRAMDAVVEIFNRPDVQAGLTRFTEMIGTAITQAVAFIPVLIEGFFSFIDFLQNNQGVVIGILAALGVAVGAWVYTVVIPAAIAAIAAFWPVIAIMAVVGAVAYLVYEAWTNNWGGIRDYLMGIWANLQPTFQALQDWLAVAIPAALQWLSDTWNNILLPALQAAWAFLQNYVFPILAGVADVISAVLSKAFEGLSGLLQKVILPALTELWSWINEKVMPVIRNLGSWLDEHLSPAFKWLGDQIGSVVDWLHKLADKLRNIELPDWMTPGSPTPWEVGLLGVSNALDTLSHTSLPRFEAAVDMQPVPIGAGEINLASRNIQPAPGTAEGGTPGENDLMLRELRQLMRSLPTEIAKAMRNESLRSAG